MRYAQIRECDVSNGEGIGVALFVQGCNFHCYNCFNKDIWDFNGGKEWTQEVENEFISLANKSYIKRISILGGEPLSDENLDDLLGLIDQIHLLLPDKNIWLYTGYQFSDFFNVPIWNVADIDNNQKKKQIILNCDVLVDGPYIDNQRDMSLKWRGSKNQRVIDIQESVKQGQVVLYCN